MSTDEPDAVLRVAGAIADGEQVDWTQRTAETKDLEELEAELRALEGLAAARREPVAGGEELTPPPFETWGGLRMIKPLGRGSFADVFLAHDPTLERDVALKLLRPERTSAEAATLFLAEARRLARVRHPHVATVHGAENHNGRIGLWMDLLDGATLEHVLSLLGRFSPYEASMVGMQLCRALAAIHGAGLLHLDLKAANVIRENGGRIILIDFGAVREIDRGRSAEAAAEGTPITMAPEQIQGLATTPSSDIYALGALLYRLVTDRNPVEARTVPELAERVAAGATTPLRDVRPDLPAEFVRVVERALSLVPQDRYASAGAMERALAMATGTFTRTELGLPIHPKVVWGNEIPLWQVAALLAGAVALSVVATMAILSRAPR